MDSTHPAQQSHHPALHHGAEVVHADPFVVLSIHSLARVDDNHNLARGRAVSLMSTSAELN
jgi:hypothetical protein